MPCSSICEHNDASVNNHYLGGPDCKTETLGHGFQTTSSNHLLFPPMMVQTEGSRVTCLPGMFLLMSDVDTCPHQKIHVLIPTDSASRNKWLPASMERDGRGGSPRGWGDPGRVCLGTHSVGRGMWCISFAPQEPGPGRVGKVQLHMQC